jgi:hypothetical protein
MRTTHFSPILFNSLQLAGQDRHIVSEETFAQFRDFISERIRMIWESQDWPDIVRFTDITSSITAVDGLVQAGIPADAGEVLTCYDRSPLASTRAMQLSFRLTDDGTTQKLTFLSDPSTVWCEYRIKRPELNGDLFSASVAYAVGSQCYFDSGSNTGSYTPVAGKPHYGNFYTCLTATTAGQSPSTHPDKWSLITIPYLFAGYAARGAYADWLRSELQIEAAQVAEAESEKVLADTVDIVIRQQGQVNRINMNRTY